MRYPDARINCEDGDNYRERQRARAAVAAIESHTLRTTPRLSEEIILIEHKKIIHVGGVHHEIDMFVTIPLGNGL